jgi:hypothetical protein
MEARELRISNLVYSNGEVVQIVQIERRYKEVYRINDVDNNQALKPIPLTEEWLLKFGFKWKNHSLNNDKIRIYSFKGNGDYSAHFTMGSNLIDIELKYVHQLQNLVYALTGKELELINQDKK